MELKFVKIVRERFDKERGRLDLNWKKIRDSDIPYIIEACQGVKNQIKKLSLSNNTIRAEGATYLSAANFPNLRTLILGRNNIGTEAAKSLSLAKFPNLTKVWLESNNIGKEEAKYYYNTKRDRILNYLKNKSLKHSSINLKIEARRTSGRQPQQIQLIQTTRQQDKVQLQKIRVYA